MTTGLKTLPAAAGWLANSLLALVFVVFSQPSYADEPIKGAFEQVLGQVFDPATATHTIVDPRLLAFSYPAPVQIPELTDFKVAVSPLSYRIYAIFATGKSDGLKPCLDTGLSLFSLVAKKYAGDQYGTSLNEYKDGRGWFLTQSKTGRSIQIKCDDKGELTMRYLDDALQQAAEVEQSEVNQINSDYAASQYAKILPRVRELVEQGNPWAETLLGLMYRKGAGVAHDDEKAEDYYQRAAQRGWFGAQYNLGTLYHSQFRYKQAETWLLKAANEEYPQAEENLAQLYLDKSPLQSEEKAFTWFLRAAEHGRPNAQYNTCFDYADGLGVARDMVEAYKWCYIAARHGQVQADRNKDHLAGQMEPQDVARARGAAERWLAQHGESK
jgi:TPR repeat protein